MIDINEALKWYPINPQMSSAEVLSALLTRLQNVILAEVPGDVCELGCHSGTTSVFFSRMIQELDPGRKLHLYDSFEGLPAKHPKDNPHYGDPGSVRTEEGVVRQRFLEYGLPMPEIHKGWFGQLPDSAFPDKVAFSFFDGDVYQSIWDSFVKVYPRTSPGGIICVHDFNVSNWPGTQAACEDYLADGPERAVQVCGLLGEVVKQ